MDRLPRMKDTLRAEDLNTEACVTLAADVWKESAEALTHAARQAAINPTKENHHHLRTCMKFYESDWFKILSCGTVEDGSAVAREIVKHALRDVRVNV